MSESLQNQRANLWQEDLCAFLLAQPRPVVGEAAARDNSAGSSASGRICKEVPPALARSLPRASLCPIRRRSARRASPLVQVAEAAFLARPSVPGDPYECCSLLCRKGRRQLPRCDDCARCVGPGRNSTQRGIDDLLRSPLCHGISERLASATRDGSSRQTDRRCCGR